MARITRVLLALVLVGVLFSPAFALEINKNWQMLISEDLELGHNHVYGPSATSSFLYRGNHGYYFEDRLGILNRWTFDSRVYELDMEGRFTNNEQIDKEDATLRKLYFKRETPNSFLQAGDFFANFSQYSLNQNLKGYIFSIKETNTNPWEVSIVGGINKTRWEYVWRDSTDEIKDTYHYGVRAGRKIGPLTAYANYVYTHEHRLGNHAGNSLNDARASTEITQNNLESIDWKFKPVSGFDLSGESAIANNHSTTVDNNYQGYAHLVKGRFRIKDLRIQGEFERTPLDFVTPGGSASSDRERWAIKNNYYFVGNEVFLNYTSYFDNTQGTLANTTKTKIPELGLTVNNLLKRKSLSTTIKARQRRRHRSNNSLDERTDTAGFTLQDKFGPFRPSLEYEYRRVHDRKDITDSGERTHTFGFGVNSYHRLLDVWTIRPNVSVKNERTHDVGPASNAGRGLNRSWIWAAGLGGSFKNDLRFDFACGENLALNYADQSNSRRNTLRFTLDYNVFGDPDNVVGVEFLANRNYYSQEASDYNEDVWKFKWSKKF